MCTIRRGPLSGRAYPEPRGVTPPPWSRLMLSSVQSSPLPTTAFAGLDAVGSARLPVIPSGVQTAATVEANLGSTPVTQRATAAMDFGEKWANDISRLADLTGIDIGGALSFAHA